MTRGDGPHIERLSELLADRAAHGLAPGDAAELDRLLAKSPEFDAESFDLAAAAIDQAFAAAASGGQTPHAMPAPLRDRIEAAAIETFARADDGRERHQRGHARSSDARATAATPRHQEPRDGVNPRIAWWGWLAAAAAVAIATLGWMRDTGSTAATPTGVRASVLAASDHVQWSWTPWAAKPASEGGIEFPAQASTGDVCWSTTAQAGVMRFVGLPKNNPGELQYQLWIIDPAQKHPIDGGVFNVDSGGEVLVTINPKIRVSNAAAFAITAEKPGGVVVSDQTKRVVIAAPPPPTGKG